MDVISRISDLRQRLAGEPRVAFVPTMGNLHEGHLTLVDVARRHAGCVVASIFVNRLQFGPSEDFDRYPRTMEGDLAGLAAHGCDVVFTPDEGELYPEPQQMFVTPPPLADELCGAMRPGHFQGVATVVAKLFNIVAPQVGVFGTKDFQQLAVIRALVRQLAMPVEIVGVETVRESDGLAMSSRNGYLSPEERAEAPRLYRVLCALRDAARAGESDFSRLESDACAGLTAHGWRVDYVALRDRATLAPPAPGSRELQVLGAAWLGRTRLIDNLDI